MRLTLLFILLPFLVIAQEKNDPQAELVVEKLKTTYAQFEDFSTQFVMTIEVPEGDNEVHKGTLIEKGEKFSLTFDQSKIICDGQFIWNYISEENEIQINDYEEEENELLLTPKTLINKISKGDLIYIIAEQRKNQQTLEFKPTDKNEEFFKIKVNITKGMVSNISMFYKNGYRYLITLSNTKTNQKIDDSLFIMDSNTYPGANIEDLRL